VLKSRLIETFVTLYVPKAKTDSKPKAGDSVGKSLGPQNAMQGSRPSTPSTPRKDFTTRTRSSTTLKRGEANGSATMPRSPPKSSPAIRSTFSPNGRPTHARSASASGSPSQPSQGRASPSPSVTKFPQRRASPAPSTSSRTSSPASTRRLPRSPSPTKPSSNPKLPPAPTPSYISPIHRPSTNPIFAIDPDNFLSDADLSAGTVRVEVWGRLAGLKWGGAEGKSEGGSKDKNGAAHEGDEWTVLESWDVELDKLAPLPDAGASPSKLPSNTLLLTLGPLGRTYCHVPPEPAPGAEGRPLSRAASPDAGYNSDPERAQEGAHVRFRESPRRGRGARASRDAEERRGRKHDAATTATFHDLVKYVSWPPPRLGRLLSTYAY
jgi:UV radiation resistance-associated gene protein